MTRQLATVTRQLAASSNLTNDTGAMLQVYTIWTRQIPFQFHFRPVMSNSAVKSKSSPAAADTCLVQCLFAQLLFHPATPSGNAGPKSSHNLAWQQRLPT